MSPTHRDITAEHFSRQAEAYAASAPHARDADLEIVARLAAGQAHETALDVATGSGNTAFRLARDVGQILAGDIAPGMLQAVLRGAAERGIANLIAIFAPAEALPFPDASLDLVTCRIAPHHFEDPAVFVAEAARILKPGGRLVVEDSLGPDEADKAAFLERLEITRDPTHVHSLSTREWQDAVARAGLRCSASETFGKQQDFEKWLTRAGADEARVAAVEAHLAASPKALVDAFITPRDQGEGRIYADQKIIFRADKTA